MINWFHKLMNPHCPQCIAERECKSCDMLRSILEQERFDKKQLLDSILFKKVEEPSAPVVTTESVGTKYTPWRVRQQLLEQEDREKARILARESKLNGPEKTQRESEQIAEMERELGIENKDAS